MTLENLIKIIDDEFILYKFEKIGTFDKECSGYEPYLEDEINSITVETGKISIALKY